MPYRLLAATELADFLRALAHPGRIQILEELRSEECDVASLGKATGLAQSSVLQHLMVLRAHRVVSERCAGRRVFYRPRSGELADWLVQGMDFLPPRDQRTDEVRKAIKKAKSKWSDGCVGADWKDNFMKRFRKILAGIDLSSWDRCVSSEFSEPKYDLVLVGTRHLGAIQGFFLGSTGIKLLRHCLCAV